MVLVAAIPVATWWLVGDQSTVPPSDDPDYAIHPFNVGLGTERAIGIGSSGLVVITLLALVFATFRHYVHPRWWIVLCPLLVAGFIVGAGWRVMTAGVIGANIGAGFVVIFCGPVVMVLLVWALAFSIHLLHLGHHAASQRTNRDRM
jgi:hypothetical protein